MGDFLKNLASRSLNLVPVVQPRLASRFEPLPFTGGFAFSASFEIAESERSDDDQTAAAQTRVQAPTARVIEARQTAFAAQLPGMLPEEKESAAGEATHLPPPERSSRQLSASAPAQPVKIASPTAHVPQPTAVSTAGPASAAADIADRPQVNDAGVRDAFKNESEPALESRIRRVLAEQLKTRAEQEPTRGFSFSESPLASEVARREMPEQAPIIRVTIGRIDVRAITSPAPQESRRAAPRPAPQLSLEDYLRQRSGGRR